LAGWKVGANAASFKVNEGAIVVNGNVAHLFLAAILCSTTSKTLN
jgi:hypothetical protein